MFNLGCQIFDPFARMWFCLYGKYIGVSSYSPFKCVLNLVLICRLHEAFHNSMIGYSVKKLKIWGLIIIIWSLFNIILNAITIETSLDINRSPKCIVFIQPYGPAAWALLDITSGIINMYLFVKPVLSLRGLCDTKNDTQDLNYVFIKKLRKIFE